MERKWVVAAKRAEFNEIAKKFSIDPVTARLIRNRDVVGDEEIRKYLHGTLQDLHDPMLMKGMKEAVRILTGALAVRKHIRVIGDYDIDGIMASYILQTGLAALGGTADVRIPERMRDGYGLNERLIREAASDGVELILTCDNGIAAAAQIALAGQLGMQTIVTDHHEVPYETMADGKREYLLPPADAVIDPKQPDCPYPFKGLCGAAIAYRLIACLYDSFGMPAERAEEFLEYAAFATVGDVMELKEENRILVKEGLKRLRNTHNPGMTELIRQSGLERESIGVYHIGFVLGPCLNASGRLDTADRALRLLMSKDPGEAAALAADLVSLNKSRKEMTEQSTKEAVRLVETTELSQDRVLVVFLPECHESLAGIIAGRLRERFGKPSFVLTRSDNDGEACAEEGTAAAVLPVKGSGRSIETYHMYDAICECADLLLKFGGHAMAAGVTLPENRLDEFRRRLNTQCTLTPEQMQPKTVIDVPMPVSYLREDLVREFELLQPFGQGNPRPVFAQKDLRVSGVRVRGAGRNVATMQLEDAGGFRMEGKFFGDADAFAAYAAAHPVLAVTYYPVIDTWRGRNALQVTVTDYR